MSDKTRSFDQQYWEERYAGEALTWSGAPNAVLVAEASSLTPGRALDIGSGEGADSLWLAQHGWRVTAVDFAETALEKARARAESADPDAATRVDWQQHDVTQWSPPLRSFDLVSAQFMHLPEPARSTLFRAIAAAVAPGGALLIVGHDASDFDENSDHRAHLVEKMFTVDDVISAIDGEGLRINVAESRQRQLSVAGGHDFHHDIIVRATRPLG